MSFHPTCKWTGVLTFHKCVKTIILFRSKFEDIVTLHFDINDLHLGTVRQSVLMGLILMTFIMYTCKGKTTSYPIHCVEGGHTAP